MAVAYVEKKSRKKLTFVLKDIGKLTEYAECAERQPTEHNKMYLSCEFTKEDTQIGVSKIPSSFYDDKLQYMIILK